MIGIKISHSSLKKLSICYFTAVYASCFWCWSIAHRKELPKLFLLTKVSRVYRRLCHREILHHAIIEKISFHILAFSIKLDPLITNMTLVFAFVRSIESQGPLFVVWLQSYFFTNKHWMHGQLKFGHIGNWGHCLQFGELGVN